MFEISKKGAQQLSNMFPTISFSQLISDMKNKKIKKSKLPSMQSFYLNHGTFEQVLKLIELDGSAYGQCSDEHRSNPTLFKTAIQTSKTKMHTFSRATTRIFNDDDLMRWAIRRYPRLYRISPRKYRNDKEYALELMQGFRCVPFTALGKKLQRDIDVVKAHLRRSYAGAVYNLLRDQPKLLDNVEVVQIELLNSKKYEKPIGNLIHLLPPSFLSDKQFALSFVKINGEFYQYVSEALKNDEDVFYAACDSGVDALAHAPCFPHRDAVLRYSGCLASAPELRGDRLLVLEAIRGSPDGYHFADKTLQLDVEVASLALRAGLKSSFLPSELWENEPFLRANVHQIIACPVTTNVYLNMPLAMKIDPDIVIKIITAWPHMMLSVDLDILNATHWIKMVASHTPFIIRLNLREYIFPFNDILGLVVPVIKEAYRGAKSINAFGFGDRSQSHMNILLPEICMEIQTFLVPPNYAEIRAARESLEAYWNLSFDALP
jgi:hypothetical protein